MGREAVGTLSKIGRKYDLPGYARLCNETGMTPIWVLKAYEETPESVIALLERLDELNLNVKAIEMGNEPYWDLRSLMNVWKYSEYCRPLAAAIREHRPDVAIGACFGPVRDDSTYAEKWNAPLAEQDLYDAVVYHEYYGGQGFALEAGVELPVEAMLHPEALFDEAFDHLEALVPGKPIWCTEWNMGQVGLKQWKNKRAELLFLGASMVRLLEDRESIEWSCFHQIYESNFGTFSFDKDTGVYTLPSYKFFRLFGASLEGVEALQMLEGEAADFIRGYAAVGEEGLRYFLLNRGDKDITAALPEGAALKGLAMKADPQVEFPISRSITRPLAIVDSTVTLPAYSISLIASEETLAKASREDENVTGNLLPVRPHVSLWYPPYARKQPRVSPQGAYEVDFSTFADKPNAQVKMDLSGINPQEGSRYRVSFEANAEPGIGNRFCSEAA
jgi:hypothetical protein